MRNTVHGAAPGVADRILAADWRSALFLQVLRSALIVQSAGAAAVRAAAGVAQIHRQQRPQALGERAQLGPADAVRAVHQQRLSAQRLSTYMTIDYCLHGSLTWISLTCKCAIGMRFM